MDKYYTGTFEYPNNILCLGTYLGHAIDGEPAITVNTLQHNGDVVYPSIYRPLTAEETDDAKVQLDIQSFKKPTDKSQGTKPKCDELEEIGIPHRPMYLPHANKDHNELKFPDFNKETMSEPDNNRSVHQQVTVVVYMHDHGNNLIGCQSDNLIHDKCLYDFKFLSE